MSKNSEQATTFYREVAESGQVWTIRDAKGFPAPLNGDGIRAQPFWSSQERAEVITRNAAAYKGFQVVSIFWQDFEEKWIPGLTKDAILIGVNWSGEKARGYDIAPETVRQHVQANRDSPSA